MSLEPDPVTRAVRAGLYALYDAAVTAGDRTGGALVAGRLLTCLDSMAKITGQMLSSPLVVNNTQNVFMHDPGFAQFQSQLVRALRGHPEARAAVIKDLRGLKSYNVNGLLPQPINFSTIFGHDPAQTCAWFMQATKTGFVPASSQPFCGKDLPGTSTASS